MASQNSNFWLSVCLFFLPVFWRSEPVFRLRSLLVIQKPVFPNSVAVHQILLAGCTSQDTSNCSYEKARNEQFQQSSISREDRAYFALGCVLLCKKANACLCEALDSRAKQHKGRKKSLSMSLCCFVANDLSFRKLSEWGDTSFSKTAAFLLHRQQEGRKQWLNDYSSVTTMLQWWLLKKIKSPLWMPIVVGLCCHSGYVTSLGDAGAWPATTGLSQRAFESGKLSALLISSEWESLRDNLWAGSVWLPSSLPTLVLVRAAVLGCISVLWMVWIQQNIQHRLRGEFIPQNL